MYTGKKILLVEDSQFVASMVGDFLKKNGFEIDNVVSGEEAVRVSLGNSEPDLILMDIELAGKMNGLEAAKIINTHKEMPIIFLTSSVSDNIIYEIRNISAYGFLEKGMYNTALLATIELALKLHSVKEELKKLSVTDYLTNTYNRRFFVNKLEEEIERSKRTGRPFSIAMFDVDHFKVLNDKYGHSAGDLVLQNITNLIKSRIRNVDCLARWGGEEFIILFTDTQIKDAGAILEELRIGISNISIPNVDHFTCSFGVTDYQLGDTTDTIIQKADNLMYEAKVSGRNCIKWRDY